MTPSQPKSNRTTEVGDYKRVSFPPQEWDYLRGLLQPGDRGKVSHLVMRLAQEEYTRKKRKREEEERERLASLANLANGPANKGDAHADH